MLRSLSFLLAECVKVRLFQAERALEPLLKTENPLDPRLPEVSYPEPSFPDFSLNAPTCEHDTRLKIRLIKDACNMDLHTTTRDAK